MKNKLMVLSLAGNVVLGALLFWAVVPERPAADSGKDAAPAVSPAPSQQATPQTRDLRATLSKAGLEPNLVTRLVVLDAIERSRSNEPAPYWVAKPVRVATLQRQRALAADQLRNQLLGVFGPDLQKNAAARPLFEPFQEIFPFLASEKQLQLQSLVVHEQQSLLERARSGPLPADPRLSTELFQRVLPEAVIFLSAEELAEMRLRVSNVAEKLRRSGFDFTEAEFRRAYAALAAKSAPQGLHLGLVPNSDNELRQALGDQRYAQYARLTDPEYHALTAAGRQANVSPEKIDAAYQAILDARQGLERIGPDRSGMEREEEIARIEAARDNKLRNLIGSAAYESVAQRRQAANARSRLRPTSAPESRTSNPLSADQSLLRPGQ